MAAFASVFGASNADPQFHFEPIATAGWIRDHHTHREHLHHSVYVAGAGARLVAPGSHWFLSVQLAATDNRTDALCSPVEFIDSVGWQHGRFTMMVRHISNGHLVGSGPNMGETMMLAGVRFW